MLNWFEFTMTRRGCVDAFMAFIEKDSRQFDEKRSLRKMSELPSMDLFYHRNEKMEECLGASILRGKTMTDLSDLLELDW